MRRRWRLELTRLEPMRVDSVGASTRNIYHFRQRAFQYLGQLRPSRAKSAHKMVERPMAARRENVEKLSGLHQRRFLTTDELDIVVVRSEHTRTNETVKYRLHVHNVGDEFFSVLLEHTTLSFFHDDSIMAQDPGLLSSAFR